MYFTGSRRLEIITAKLKTTKIALGKRENRNSLPGSRLLTFDFAADADSSVRFQAPEISGHATVL
jgi:hypothetical protein